MICEKSVAHYPLENWGKELQFYERIQVVLMGKNRFKYIVYINKDYRRLVNYNLNTLFNLEENSHTVSSVRAYIK